MPGPIDFESFDFENSEELMDYLRLRLYGEDSDVPEYHARSHIAYLLYDADRVVPDVARFFYQKGYEAGREEGKDA